MPARALILLPVASALAVAAAPAWAQQKAPPAYPPFPTARSLPAMQDWVRRYTDVPAMQVVGIAADSVFAIEPSRSAPGSRVVRTVIRQEAITPEFAKRLGGRSASMSADIDCRGRRVFQREVVLYAGSNRQGAGRPMGAASDWQAIPAGTFMERVMTAVCDPDWRPLFAEGVAPPPPRAPVQAVQAPPAYSQPPPAPAPQPPYSLPPPAYASPPPPRPAYALGPGRAEIGRFLSADAAVNALGAVAGAAPLSAAMRVENDGTAFRAVVEGFANRTEAETFCLRVRGCTLVP